MNEVNPLVKRTFNGMGTIYSIFSIAAIVIQTVVLKVLMLIIPDGMSVDFEVGVSSICLYVTGLVVLRIGFIKTDYPKTTIEKHNLKVLDFIKAFSMCYALLIVSNIIGLAITSVIGVLKGSPVINPVENMAMEMSMPAMFILTVILAPIFEELFFRKLIIDRTIRFGEVPCMILSGFMFGMFHGNLSQFPYAFTIGVFLAYLYIRTGRLIYPILMHAIINFMGSVAGVLVLKSMENSAFMQTVEFTNEADMVQLLLSYLTDKGFMILMIYEVFVLSIVVIGLILWILQWKKISFKVQEHELPKGNRLVHVMGNYGMLVYTAIWVVMIIINTLTI